MSGHSWYCSCSRSRLLQSVTGGRRAKATSIVLLGAYGLTVCNAGTKKDLCRCVCVCMLVFLCLIFRTNSEHFGFNKIITLVWWLQVHKWPFKKLFLSFSHYILVSKLKWLNQCENNTGLPAFLRTVLLHVDDVLFDESFLHLFQCRFLMIPCVHKHGHCISGRR